MQNKIKLTGSVGRGEHFLKKLLKVDGTSSSTYKIETELNYKILDSEHLVGTNVNKVNSLRLAGGPTLTKGAFLEEINGHIVDMQIISNYGPVITVEYAN
jgi:hypothetical protein